jgi:hypothetical protein
MTCCAPAWRNLSQHASNLSPHAEERRAAAHLEARGPRRRDNNFRLLKSPRMSASFLARDQPLIWRSAEIASV